MHMSKIAAAKERMAELGSLSSDDPVLQSKVLQAEYIAVRAELLRFYGQKADARMIDPWGFRRYEAMVPGVVVACSYSVMAAVLDAAEKSGYPEGGDRFDPDISQWGEPDAVL